MEIDFSERKVENERSLYQEDKLFLKKVKEGTKKVEGHYEIPLPFREDDVIMPDNRAQVEQRAHWIKKKLLKDNLLHKQYTEFMNDMLVKGYARKVPLNATCSMFYQVRIPKDQCNFVRFLWWPDGDLSQDLAEYEMTVHIFGAVSSPSCSNFGLCRAADDYECKIGTESTDVLCKNFYVDDCLRSDKTVHVAINRMHNVIDACAHGGFHLTKLTSNDRRVLETIPTRGGWTAIT